MDMIFNRREFVGVGIAFSFTALPACTTGLGGFGLEEAIRRILTLSSQRAFTNLLQENGFFQDDLARIPLPPQLGGAGLASALASLLGTTAVQDRLLRLVNFAASEAAEAAAPVVYDSIRTMTIADAVSIVRGGPTAATDYLQRSMGNAIFNAMFPGLGNILTSLEGGIFTRVLGYATGIDLPNLQHYVATRASEGIYRAIGREEAAIRANPASVNDPVISGVFGVLG